MTPANARCESPERAPLVGVLRAEGQPPMVPVPWQRVQRPLPWHVTQGSRRLLSSGLMPVALHIVHAPPPSQEGHVCRGLLVAAG